MKLPKQKILCLVAGLAILLSSSATTAAQEDNQPKKKLKSPAVVKGNVGGEAHDSFVIHARKGKRMTVEISWTRDGDNTASFTVSPSPDFFGGQPLRFGKASKNGELWTGKIPRTRNYYIYVVAHPAADYRLKVTLR